MKCQNRERSVRTQSGRGAINPDLDLPLEPVAIALDTDTLLIRSLPLAVPIHSLIRSLPLAVLTRAQTKKRDERASSLVPRQRD